MTWHPSEDNLAAESNSTSTGANLAVGLDSDAKDSMLSEALRYSRLGFSVIPVGRDKKPLIVWKKYQTERATEQEIREWFSQFPDANIAAVTGAISNIVVIDVEKGGSVAGYSPTVISKTGGGGWHLFYKHPGFQIKNNTRVKPLTDIRGDGGYVVLPPSLHASGNKYEWSIAPEDGAFADWSAEPFDDVQNIGGAKSTPSDAAVPQGKRNDTATRFIGKLLHLLPKEMWETVIWSAAKEWNQKNCIPPLEEKELRSVFESIAQRESLNGKSTTTKSEAQVRRFSDIKPEPVSWLWNERIALGKITLIAGDPGLGKSLITAFLAAVVSKGYRWVDGTSAPVGDVVLLSAEDDPGDTIRPRLDAAEADCDRIRILESVREYTADGTQTHRIFSFKRDVALLDECLSSLPNCKLVIVDPVSAYLDGTDSNNNSDVRGLFAPLADLAKRYKVAVVLIQHLNKSAGGTALYRPMGSLAFIAAARAAFIVTKEQNNPQRRLFMPAKNNLAKDATGLAYQVITAENGAPVIAWESEPITITADEALTPAQPNEERTAMEEAKDFLLDTLANGPKKASEIEREAQEAGIGRKTLRNARTKLGIKSIKSGFEGGWVLILPQDAPKNEEALTITEGNLGAEGQLGQDNF